MAATEPRTPAPHGNADWTKRLAFVDKPRTEDVFGDHVDALNLDDVGPGWSVVHGTQRYGADGEYDIKTNAPIGTPKGGCVVDRYDRDGVAMVTVIEDRMVEGRLDVRRHDWPVSELDPDRCHEAGIIARHSAAKKVCAAIGRNTKGSWNFATDGDEFLIASAYALTEPERQRLAEWPASTHCAGGHCVDAGGDCEQAADHLGVCCFCPEPVGARKAGRSR